MEKSIINRIEESIENWRNICLLNPTELCLNYEDYKELHNTYRSISSNSLKKINTINILGDILKIKLINNINFSFICRESSFRVSSKNSVQLLNEAFTKFTNDSSYIIDNSLWIVRV